MYSRLVYAAQNSAHCYCCYDTQRCRGLSGIIQCRLWYRGSLADMLQSFFLSGGFEPPMSEFDGTRFIPEDLYHKAAPITIH